MSRRSGAGNQQPSVWADKTPPNNFGLEDEDDPDLPAPIRISEVFAAMEEAYDNAIEVCEKHAKKLDEQGFKFEAKEVRMAAGFIEELK